MTAAWKARAKQRASLLATRERTTSHDGRTSIEEAACSSPQPPDPRGDGGAEAGGSNPFDRAIAIYSAQQAAGVAQYQAYQNSLVAFQHNTSAVYHTASNYLTQAQPGGLIWYNNQSYSVPLHQAFMQMPVDDGLYKTPLPVEIRPGEIVAWRCWWVDPANGKYMSTSMYTLWELDKPMIGKPSNGTEGVHAWKTKALAEKYARDLTALQTHGGARYLSIAIGTIELWGEVIEHEEGYRAQFGQIKEIVETRAAQTGPSNPYLPVLRPSVGNYVHAVYAPDSGANGPYSSWERAFGLRPVGAPMDEREGPVKVIAMCALVACMLALLVFGIR